MRCVRVHGSARGRGGGGHGNGVGGHGVGAAAVGGHRHGRGRGWGRRGIPEGGIIIAWRFVIYFKQLYYYRSTTYKFIRTTNVFTH